MHFAKWLIQLWAVHGFKYHDDVIKWKHIPRNWPFVRGIHRSPVNSPHKGQWRGTLMFCLISARINCWVNNRFNSILRSTTQEKRYVNVRVLIHTKLLKYTSFVLGILLFFQLCLTICHFVAWLWNYGYLLVTCSTVIFIHLFIHSFQDWQVCCLV